ncbi:MAG: hypothetical protein AAF806_09190 [Bacteroidota bacterium]
MNDFFEQENFEDFFRENLENYESEPSDSMWERLEHNIPLKPTMGGSLISSLIGLFVGISAVWLFYLSIQEVKVLVKDEVKTGLSQQEQVEENLNLEQQNKESVLEQSIGDQSKKDGTEQLVVKSKKDKTTESITRSREVMERPLVDNRQENLKTELIKEQPISFISKSAKKVNLLSKYKEEILVPKQIVATATQTDTLLFKEGEGEKNKRFFSQGYAQRYAELDRQNDVTNDLEKSEHNHRNLLMSIRHGKSVPFESVMNMASSLPKQRSVSKAKDRQKGEWSLEVSYSPHIWTSLKTKKEGYQTKQLLGKIHKTTNYGVIATERRKNGWGFEGGFIYGRYHLRHELNKTIEFSYLNSFLDEEGHLTGTYLLNIESPFWKEDRPVNVKYTNIQEPFIQEGEAIALKGYYTQMMNSFQVPAGANYQIELNSKLNLILQGGVAWSFLTVPDGSLSDVYLSNDALEIIKVSEAEKLVFESIDAYLGIGLEYRFSDEFKLKIAPRYMTTFRNRANHNDQINLSSLQLNIGLSYPLIK